MRLRNFDRPHRRRKVRPRGHPHPDLVEIVLQIGFELLDGLSIHPRGTLLLPDALVRFPPQPLRYVKRPVLRIRLAHARPPRPRPVARATKSQMSRPLRSTLITSASSLLRAGPPARAATVLSASQFLLHSALPLAIRRSYGQRIAVSAPAFPRSL